MEESSVYPGQGDRWANGPSVTNLVGDFLFSVGAEEYFSNFGLATINLDPRTLWKI